VAINGPSRVFQPTARRVLRRPAGEESMDSPFSLDLFSTAPTEHRTTSIIRPLNGNASGVLRYVPLSAPTGGGPNLAAPGGRFCQGTERSTSG
jgi:hypothetical protein